MKKPLHFQRGEEKNIGLIRVATTGMFRKGYNDYISGNVLSDFGDKEFGLLHCQTAYELGRLFAAYLKSENKLVKKWYVCTKKFIVSTEVLQKVARARSDKVFC